MSSDDISEAFAGLPGVALDDDAMVATVDLVGRTGARELQVGYLDDDVPVAEARWYAHVRYRGARIGVEDQRGPVEALDALARRLLTGAKCAHCGGLVALSDRGATAYVSDVAGARGHFADGTSWTAAEAAAAGQCRWRRVGPRWQRGCEGDRPAARPAGSNRVERRRRRRRGHRS